MIALNITFISGRFHATPWGHHVNEGTPEWPPSPWRILRAIVATWKRKLNGHPDCDAAVVESLLKKLSVPPSYYLPHATTGHTRHFMPWYKIAPSLGKMIKEEKRREYVLRAKIFDNFVATNNDDTLFVVFPDTILSSSELRALRTIVQSIGFIGRAESWVDVQVLNDEQAEKAAAMINCMPQANSQEKDGYIPVRVLCADPETAFLNEHTPKNTTYQGRGKNKKPITTPLYDPDWHLCMDTLELHEKRWSDPPGSQWVTYLRPADCFSTTVKKLKCPKESKKPNIARFSIDASVLPLVEETLWVAEEARRVAMGCYRRVEENRLGKSGGASLPRSDVFSGKDESGQPLDGHTHAYYIPTDEDGDGRIDKLTIFAERGFSSSEIKALDRMRRLPRDNGEPVNLLFLSLSTLEDPPDSQIFGKSRIWISATPFFVTRYPKTRGKKRDPPYVLGANNNRIFAQYVLMEEIERLRERRKDIPKPQLVEPLNDEHRCGAHMLRPLQFKQFRRYKREIGGQRAAGAFRVIFPTAVRGPIVLGYGAHFGLGLFVPADERKENS